MKFRIPGPQTLINITAGLIGLLFDELEGVTSEAQPDDLTKISGIGPAFARRLNESGIFTYDQLAELSPEQVREMVHLSELQGDPEEWIRQARGLA